MSDTPRDAPTEENMISPERFGRDHWSTLAYLETRAVDAGGEIDRRRMRCDRSRHPHLVGPYTPEFSESYPTRLANGEVQHDHDDWDCFDDLEAAGYLENVGTGAQPRVKLTALGHAKAAELRTARAQRAEARR